MTGGIGGLCGWASPPPPSLTPTPPAEHPAQGSALFVESPCSLLAGGGGAGRLLLGPSGPMPSPRLPRRGCRLPWDAMRLMAWGRRGSLVWNKGLCTCNACKMLEMRSCWRGARRQESDRAAGQTEKEAHRRVEEKPREGRQRWQRCVTSRGAPGATSSWQRQEGASLRASRRSQPCRHPGFGVQNREGIGIWHFQLKSVLVC